jgi:hypothetical protein
VKIGFMKEAKIGFLKEVKIGFMKVKIGLMKDMKQDL